MAACLEHFKDKSKICNDSSKKEGAESNTVYCNLKNALINKTCYFFKTSKNVPGDKLLKSRSLTNEQQDVMTILFD